MITHKRENEIFKTSTKDVRQASKQALDPNEEKMKKYKQSYDAIKYQAGIAEHENESEKIRKIIILASESKTEFYRKSDEIKQDLFDDAKEYVPFENSDRRQFMDIINIVARAEDGKDLNKIHDKFNESISRDVLINSTKKSVLDKYVMNPLTEVVVPVDFSQEIILPEVEEEPSTEFIDLIKRGVVSLQYIKDIIKPMLKTYEEAAIYVTGGKMTPKEYKTLLDWYHFRDGGYPTPTTKPKMWSLIYNFWVAYKTASTYGYTEFLDLLDGFGLIIEDTDVLSPGVLDPLEMGK